MGIFDNALRDEESLFLNPVALDFEFIPPIVKFRENNQQYIATCIKPLLQKRSGRNLFIFGTPGIGKTLASRHVLKEMNEETDEIIPVYINCWKKDTSYKIALHICELINYKWTQNKKTDELLKEIAKILNKKSVVFVFDECDQLKDYTALYSILEDVYKKTVIMITNEKSWHDNLDIRLKSRLNLDLLQFKPYNLQETKEILKQRVEYAFAPGVFDMNNLDLISSKAFELSDVRTGIYLLKESGDIAEGLSSKKISQEHVKQALEKLDKFKVRSSADLSNEENELLNLVRNNSGKTATELHKLYSKEVSYKTFRRRLEDLNKARLILIEEESKGIKGRSTIIKANSIKKLTDY